MAKFKVGDKVRLKKGLKVGAWYGGTYLSKNMRESAKANGGIHEVREIRITQSCTTYYLDHTYSFTYAEEMLELVEEEEEDTKDLKDLFELLTLMSQLQTIIKRLDELKKSKKEE